MILKTIFYKPLGLKLAILRVCIYSEETVEFLQ